MTLPPDPRAVEDEWAAMFATVPAGWQPRLVTEICDGFDIPTKPWTAEDIAFWTGTPTYTPWKDVAAFFEGTKP